MQKIKARTSLLTRFRPPTWLILETHVQYKRNPARCQFTTVLGVTKTRGCLHPDQHILNATQNSLCRAVNRRRGRCACRASNCRRRARFSRTRSARQLKELTNQPRKCRSDKIMAKNFSGKDRIELCAKSLISQVYDLLARPVRPWQLWPELVVNSAFYTTGKYAGETHLFLTPGLGIGPPHLPHRFRLSSPV